jgi:hypothetical protein
MTDQVLRKVLLLDAGTCVAAGAAMSLLAGPLARLTAIPEPLLLTAGLALFPVAAFMAFVARMPSIPKAAVWLIVLGNAAWVAGSALLLLAALIRPNGFGVAFILAQALAVAVLAWLEFDRMPRREMAAA